MENKTSDIDNLFLEGRTIWLNSGVNENSMDDVVRKMLYLSAVDPKSDIYLMINSPGGSVTSGLVLVDVINSIPNDVVTIGMGMCASMGQLFVTSGTNGKRYIGKHGRVMMHQPSGGFYGDHADIQREMVLINQMKDQLAGITAGKTGQTLERVKADGERDAWFTADEAVEYGFVDHVVENIFDLVPMLQAGERLRASQDTERELKALQVAKLRNDLAEAGETVDTSEKPAVATEEKKPKKKAGSAKKAAPAKKKTTKDKE